MRSFLIAALILLATSVHAAEQHTWYLCTHEEHRERNGHLPLGARIVGVYINARADCAAIIRFEGSGRTIARQALQPGTHRFGEHYFTVDGPVVLKAWAGRDAQGERIPCYAHADVYFTCEPPCELYGQHFPQSE